MIASSFGNIQSLPIFGYGAKTTVSSQRSSPLFPISRSIKNPNCENKKEAIEEAYKNCLNAIEISLPIELNPLFLFIKKLGNHIKSSINKR